MKIPLQEQGISEFCRKWNIREMALFGSALRDDFKHDSDVDVLVNFAEKAHWGFQQWVEMREELARMLGGRVDLVSQRSLRNPFRRHEILSTRKVIYVA